VVVVLWLAAAGAVTYGIPQNQLARIVVSAVRVLGSEHRRGLDDDRGEAEIDRSVVGYDDPAMLETGTQRYSATNCSTKNTSPD
jgi:hypothetical protein